MNLSFLRNDPLKSVIVDTATGQPVYEVKTPWKFTRRTTTIKRSAGDSVQGDGEIVSQIRWREWGSTTITIGGTETTLRHFLKSDGILSR